MDKLESYNFGPEPVLKAPDLEGAMQAQQALAEAVEKNSKSRKPVAGVTEAQAETLLEWMVHTARRGVLDHERAMRPSISNISPVAFFSGHAVAGTCTDAMVMIGTQAKRLGLTARYHDTFALTGIADHMHSFSVVIIPVADAKGKVTETPYLVDATFRQFFNPNSFETEWGNTLLRTESGKQLADTLLSRGFVPLTQQTEMLYMGTHPIPEDEEIKPKNKVKTLLQNSIIPSSWYDRQMGRYCVDLRTPIMVAQGSPVEAMGSNFAGVLVDGIKHRGVLSLQSPVLDKKI